MPERRRMSPDRRATKPQGRRSSRRNFLAAGTVTAGAGAAAILSGRGPQVVSPPELTGALHGGGRNRQNGAPSAHIAATNHHIPVFGRLFPDLPAFAEPSEALTEALSDIGRPGGILDAGDDLTAGPVELITEPALSEGNPDNETQTAGTTFLGQFFDHDLTFDASSPLGVPTVPGTVANERSAFLDLDSVYGAGPAGSPHLYEPDDRVKLRLETGGRFEDLPRDEAMQALIADPRNDNNLMVAGLHAAFYRFHNAVVDRTRSGQSDGDVFQEARREVTWHYQWIIVNEYLPQILGQSLTDDVLTERRFYQPDQAIIPVEFQGAAFRFGHSQIRPSYRANLDGDPDGDAGIGAPAFFGFVFDPAGEGQDDPVDLRGGARAPRRFIDWETFFDFEDGEVRPNKRIDTHLSTPLFNLPLGAIPTADSPTSLAARNLLRHLTWSLPSGQAVAEAMGVDVVSAADLEELSGYGLNLDRSTPLWYYVLKEAELMADGLTLGPVGGRIVGEVFAGVLRLDPGSYLNQDGWTPTLPSHLGEGQFTMRDLLTVAGVDPANRAS